MRQSVTAIVTLILAGVGIWFVLFLSTHDEVQEIVDVNQLTLKQGRTIYLIGVGDSDLLPESMLDSTSVPATLISQQARIEKIKEIAEARDIKLVFPAEMEPDSSSESLHAYVELEDGTDLNAWIIGKGLALVHPEHKHPRAETYMTLQNEARDKELGIWNLPPASVVEEEMLEK